MNQRCLVFPVLPKLYRGKPYANVLRYSCVQLGRYRYISLSLSLHFVNFVPHMIFFDFWFNKFISIRIKICANAWTIFLVQKFPCGERFMLSSFMHKLEVKRNCLRWRCGSVIFVLTISLIWDVTRLLWSFEAKYPSPVILVFQKTMFYANRWLKIRIVSCERAFVTPGRNIGKLAAKSKEERTPSAMRPVGKYHNEKFESYLLL